MDFKKLNINIIFISIVALVIAGIFKYEEPKTINVSGEFSKKIQKDRISVVLNIKNLDKNSSVAIQKSNKTYNEISSYIEELKKSEPLLEIQTTEYTTYEKQEWNQNLKKNIKLGVESLIALEITTQNSESIKNILDKISKFNDIYLTGFNTFVSKETLQKEQAEGLTLAVKNAKEKATYIAKGNNQKIGKMVAVNAFNDISNYAPRAMYKSVSASAESVYASDMAPIIYTGSADVSVKVNAVFELK